MKYIKKIVRPLKLEVDSRVVFEMSDGTIYTGDVCDTYKDKKYYFIGFSEGNGVIFNKLGIDKDKFVSDLVGYSAGGIWPETETLEDLDKVLQALVKVNKQEPEEEPKEEKPTSSSKEWDWLLG